MIPSPCASIQAKANWPGLQPFAAAIASILLTGLRLAANAAP